MLIISRLTPFMEPQLMPQEAGFREDKSITGQFENLTKHEVGLETKLITGFVFADLCAAYGLS